MPIVHQEVQYGSVARRHFATGNAVPDNTAAAPVFGDFGVQLDAFGAHRFRSPFEVQHFLEVDMRVTPVFLLGVYALVLVSLDYQMSVPDDCSVHVESISVSRHGWWVVVYQCFSFILQACKMQYCTASGSSKHAWVSSNSLPSILTPLTPKHTMQIRQFRHPGKWSKWCKWCKCCANGANGANAVQGGG